MAVAAPAARVQPARLAARATSSGTYRQWPRPSQLAGLQPIPGRQQVSGSVRGAGASLQCAASYAAAAAAAASAAAEPQQPERQPLLPPWAARLAQLAAAAAAFAAWYSLASVLGSPFASIGAAAAAPPASEGACWPRGCLQGRRLGKHAAATRAPAWRVQCAQCPGGRRACLPRPA